MPIHFIPNDPLAASLAGTRKQNARGDRPSSRAGFRLADTIPEDLYGPGTPEFLHWQCREAALCAVETWESIAGNLDRWARARPQRRTLSLIPNGGEDLNAYYDGQSLSFFRATTGQKTTFSGASTDVVAHEAGHACLDAIRPDLWDSNFTETAAFHEAFGDCLAILTALFDADTRKALLKDAPKLDKENFVEATAEDLSDGVRRRLGKNHPAAAPRHAFNEFRWQLPTSLPTSGPPSRLTSEVHSFGRVFSGCFYDLVRFIFQSLGSQGEAQLLEAARTAGRLLVRGAQQAPDTERFFQAVGRSMVLSDAASGGQHREMIRSAFERHGIALGSAAMLAPRATLEGPPPRQRSGRRAASISLATREDLKRRLGARSDARLSIRPTTIGDTDVVEAIHYREVPLDGVSERLTGVVALAPEPVLVGRMGGRAALLGDLPEPTTAADEVRHFVATLLDNDSIAVDDGGRRSAARRRTALAAVAEGGDTLPATHVVRVRGGKQVLERIGFVCGCHAAR